MDREKVIKELERTEIMLKQAVDHGGEMAVMGTFICYNYVSDAIALLKEQDVFESKTIPEELKLKMWNALYAVEDRFEKKYIGTKEQDSWFLIYRPWLQEGFNLAIKAIADWEEG